MALLDWNKCQQLTQEPQLIPQQMALFGPPNNFIIIPMTSLHLLLQQMLWKYLHKWDQEQVSARQVLDNTSQDIIFKQMLWYNAR